MVAGSPSATESGASDLAKRPCSAQDSATWVDLLPKNDHNDFFRAFDFSTTLLGPKSSWSPALRLYVSMVMADSRPANIYWGPERVSIYNEAFIQLISSKHPMMMGQALKTAFPEIWDDTSGMFEQAAATRKTVDVHDIALSVVRHGRLEECYFVGQFIPLAGESGEIEGFYNTSSESTNSVIHARRRKVVDEIASTPIGPLDATLEHIMNALRRNPKDIPLAMLYSYDELEDTISDDLQLRGSIAVPEGHTCAPHKASLYSGSAGIVPYLRQAFKSGSPVVIDQGDEDSGSKHLFEGVEWSGHEIPSPKIIILGLSSGKRTFGFYLQGINPRRPYDEGVEMSIVDTARQIEARWAASISNQEARQREQILERKLTNSERKLRHVAQSAPLGMCQVSSEGVIEWANENFFSITGIPRDKTLITDFAEYVHPDDRERCLSDFAKLATGETATSSELRLTRRWSPPLGELHDGDDGTDVHAWVLTNAIAVRDHSQVTQILGYITEISSTKWSESVQVRNAQAALLARRRQEEFIDTTSHEMRNPLSAITQLADGIARSLDESQNMSAAELYEAMQDNVSSANVILACAAHQKRVIDDVLILSRLESQMLSITPVEVQPSTIVENTLSMLKSEAVVNNIAVGARRDRSYDDMRIEHVLCDTSRLTQILINLISNAIKFTSQREERSIAVLYGAQTSRPPHIPTKYGDLEWVPHRYPGEANSSSDSTGDDDQILYLYFAVEDTGPGLTPTETRRLFKRFSQANSKTHISYGGSGLGLWISKKLAEKQGGQIGVASRRNEGATFAFYIAARRTELPQADADRATMSLLHTTQAPIETRSATSSRTKPSEEVASNGHPRSQSLELSPPRSVQGHSQQVKPVSPRPGQYHIILVEDNLVNQRVLAKQLQKAGCVIHIANHGIEALEVIQKTDCWSGDRDDGTFPSEVLYTDSSSGAPLKVDVILMDWEMPKMDGLTCTKRIRELEVAGRITRRLPVIATTANVRQEQRDQALAAGMDSVMSKPFSVAELLIKIQETLEPETTVTAAPS